MRVELNATVIPRGKPCRVAIDGPAGSGKSTTARLLASQFAFMYVDSGAIYRSVTLAAIRNGLLGEGSIDVAALMKCFDSFDISISIPSENPNQTKVILNGEDISTAIRTAAVNEAVGTIAAIKEVREAVAKVQHRLITSEKEAGVVMDGRDIGTVIIPDAEVKIFLIASPKVRAQRRFAEVCGSQSYESILESITTRDRQDTAREHSPLVRAADAIEIDTSNLTIDDQVKEIAALITRVLRRDK